MKSFAVLALAVMVAHGALAQQPAAGKLHLHLDPAKTEVHFTLKDTVHTVQGSFHLNAGEIVFDPVSGEASGTIAVDTWTGASGNDSRDGKMKREFLEVTKFPVATFEPTQVTGWDAGVPEKTAQKIKVSGTMTLHGSSHVMTMEFAVSHDGDATVAVTHFLIPYVAWGIKDPSIALIHVEKEVSMDIAARGTMSAAK